uniref:Ig-like domain-containing protein n=1 Tax=Crocodylus porosus TaxID=8502 RepID=A0A7M4EYV9_CROPO
PWLKPGRLRKFLMVFAHIGTQGYVPVESREEGETLSVQCPYNQPYRKMLKAWCRYVDEGYCSILVSTYSSYGHYRYRDQAKRTTIHDNAQNGTVTITMDKLQADDSGVYRCTLYASPRLYRLLEVQLAVSKGKQVAPVNTCPLAFHLYLCLLFESTWFLFLYLYHLC